MAQLRSADGSQYNCYFCVYQEIETLRNEVRDITNLKLTIYTTMIVMLCYPLQAGTCYRACRKEGLRFS